MKSKNYYEIIGVNEDATEDEIKRAYKKQALKVHSDKGGDDEQMKLLNEAKNVLCNQAKRKTYSIGLDFMQDIIAFFRLPIKTITEGTTPAYSSNYRNTHSTAVNKYRHTRPLSKRKVLKPEIHTLEIGNKKLIYSDGYSDIHTKFEPLRQYKTFNYNKKITPSFAIECFIHFLEGSYDDLNLVILKKYFVSAIAQISSESIDSKHLPLYECINNLISMIQEKPSANLALTLQKITTYALTLYPFELPPLIPLFYNRNFRNLHAFALHLYWESPNDLVFPNDFLFDGIELGKKWLEEKKLDFLTDTEDENKLSNFRFARFILDLEKDLNSHQEGPQNAETYREKAFHYLDWIPSLLHISGGEIIHFFVLRIGFTFQQAARLEKDPSLQMADEKLALNMYMEGVSLAHRLTPNVELSVYTEAITFMKQLAWDLPELERIINSFKNKVHLLGDFFPLLDLPKSLSGRYSKKENELELIRDVLHALTTLCESENNKPGTIQLPHKPSVILYQAYEACLKNWYQNKHEAHNPKLENHFRLSLMKVLLAEKGQDFDSVEKLLLSPNVMINRDKEGYLQWTGKSAFPEKSEFQVFRSINGFEIDHSSGAITLFLNAWESSHQPYEKTFSSNDLLEIFENTITGAFFSLDMVDPDQPYHPFNNMVFSDSLYKTELLHTMLITDYILKFLTTGVEVQGAYPFNFRPVSHLLKSLPAYLQKIITDYQCSKHSEGAIHRFWIEAETADVYLDESDKDQYYTRVSLENMKMVIKKHLMERDLEGNLKDTNNEKEGWPFYVLTETQFDRFCRGKRRIDDRAMIFVHGKAQVYFWQNGSLLISHKPVEVRNDLIRLYTLSPEKNGLISFDSSNMPLIYRLTTTLCEQTKLPHHYSPEWIFAHLFTTHYDEFAQYIPEFGRLKELSKIVALTRILHRTKESNLSHRDALFTLLNNLSPDNLKDPELYESYKENYQTNYTNILEQFGIWQNKYSTKALQKKWEGQLQKIKSKAYPLEYDSSSDAVWTIAYEQFKELKSNNYLTPSEELWKYIDKSDIAKKLSQLKQQNFRKQLNESFTKPLSYLPNYYCAQHINTFINGNSKPLANALAENDRSIHHSQIAELYTNVSEIEVNYALDSDEPYYLQKLVNKIVTEPLKKSFATLNQLEKGFQAIGFYKEEKKSLNLNNQCFWVPAAVRHEVKPFFPKNNQNLHSFFVYGGVNLQTRTTYLYQKVGPNGEHGKFGITVNPDRRYSAEKLNGGSLKIIAQGNRQEMLRLERNCHTYLPIGPEERQPYYVKLQASMGYKTPPY